MNAKRVSKMSEIVNLNAADVRSALDAGEITLVDVREPHEFAARHVAGSINVPLSSFDPDTLPNDPGKPVVFMCAGGVRSARAIEATLAAGLPWNKHLAGGINAWIQAGEPTE
jgi:rhodanese-related sulfurtransferase